MTSRYPDVVISADAHVGEPEGLRRRLPARWRKMLAELKVDADYNINFPIDGKLYEKPHRKKPTVAERVKEFRDDPWQGTNIDRRLHDMALEGVDAQVIFPNIGLTCSMGNEPAAYYRAWARAHNDHVWEVFGPHHKRFKPAAMIAVDDPKQMLAEAKRCIRLGFASLFMPATVPWQPYRLPVYDKLWSLCEEAGVPVNFHVYSGNLGLDGDFASIASMDDRRIKKAKAVYAEERRTGYPELVGITSIGAAAGMSPILQLAGSGVLERHPKLKFVIVESEAGWLAWVLQMMDQLQERRHLNMFRLKLRPSEYFRRQGAVTMMDDAVALNNVRFTGTDCLVWANDYPHDEGIFPGSPKAIETIRKTLTPKQAHDVLCGNAARIYGFDLEWLAKNRAEVARHRHVSPERPAPSWSPADLKRKGRFPKEAPRPQGRTSPTA
jgi:predicted TIM-barrel fold metal-dependent hydrolase